MTLEKFDPYDDIAVAEAIVLSRAVQEVDEPWQPAPIPQAFAGFARHGWDGEPDQHWLLRADDTGAAIGRLSLDLPRRDNRHYAGIGIEVHPDHRRRGHGTRLLEEGLRLAREAGRRVVTMGSVDAPSPKAFAEKHGFSQAAVEVQRRQDPSRLEPAELARMRTAATERASDYTLLRFVDAVPDDMLDDVAELTAAINDAPTDDLDIEDEVFDAERIRAFEHAQAASGHRMYRLIARKGTDGPLAGHTIVAVHPDRPDWAWQYDTSVLAAHRGHRLGMLLKADMLTWLAETAPGGAEPRHLERRVQRAHDRRERTARLPDRRPLPRTPTEPRVKLERLDPYDDNGIAAAVSMLAAAQAVDEPGRNPPPTFRGYAADLRHRLRSPVQHWLLRSDAGQLIGDLSISLPQRDNLHQATVRATVHPEHRRRGHGAKLVEEGQRIARDAGRRSVISFSDDAAGPRAFAERLGFCVALVSVLRRQDLTELDRDELARMRAHAAEKAGDYTLLRLIGPVPDDLVDDVAEMAMAINDAPRDELDEEDEVIDADRIRADERLSAAAGERVYQVIARHRETGELAGHTVVEVDSTRPEWGGQGDTSVLAAHRGHRLGLLLKADMLTWLADEEPALRYLTTGNAETNQHMIAINEQLGYRVLTRLLVWQRGLEN